MKLTLVHLYPELMNLYGDRGNVLCLVQRAKWRGIDLEVKYVSIKDELPKKYDLLFMGGGQDRGQELVANDLFRKGHDIKTAIESDVPALVICGGYQLFGHYFMTSEGKRLQGIGVFNASTSATQTRLIGNVLLKSDMFGELIGFENHSGQTVISASSDPLGRVVRGHGNNESSKMEGIVYKNAIGTYLHGSFLPKNPVVADFLLAAAIRRHRPDYSLKPLDDTLSKLATEQAKKRP